MISLIMPTLDVGKATKTAGQLVERAGLDIDLIQSIIVCDQNRAGFTRTVNYGISKAKYAWTCLVNDDVVLPDNWLADLQYELMHFRMYKRIDVQFAAPAGPCRTWPQNDPKHKTSIHASRIVRHLAGFCLLIHPTARGYLNEEFIHYGSDVDFQWRRGASLLVPKVYCKHELHPPHQEWWQKDQETLKRIWRL